MSEDTAKLLASLVALAALVGVVWGISDYNAHRPCSDFNNVSVRYAPLRCLPGQ